MKISHLFLLVLFLHSQTRAELSSLQIFGLCGCFTVATINKLMHHKLSQTGLISRLAHATNTNPTDLADIAVLAPITAGIGCLVSCAEIQFTLFAAALLTPIARIAATSGRWRKLTSGIIKPLQCPNESCRGVCMHANIVRSLCKFRSISPLNYL